MRPLSRSRFVIIAALALAAVAVACGSDNSASEPTATPTSGPATQTPTPTPAPGSTETPTSTSVVPTETPGHSEIQSALGSARQKWLSNRPPSYTFDLAWSCFCPNSGVSTRIEVSGSEIVSTTDPVTGAPRDDSSFLPHLTVDGLFDWIQQGLDTDAGNVLSAEFERDLGYPISASVDWIVGAIDDESGFQVTNFRIGTGQVDVDQLKRRLADATDLWIDSGYDNYEFVLSRQCFCPPGITAPIRIEVRGGQVFSATSVETGQPVDDSNVTIMTIPELFNWISEKLNRDPEFAELEFDTDNGHPTKVSINPIINLFDDEEAFFVEDLEPIDVHAELQIQLDDARELWGTTAFSKGVNHSYTFNWQCFCVQEYVETMRIFVVDGKVDRVIRVESGQPVSEQFRDSFETVEGLFNRLQDAIDRRANSIRAEFDEGTGLPTEVFIDYEAILADEELGWNASPPRFT